MRRGVLGLAGGVLVVAMLFAALVWWPLPAAPLPRFAPAYLIEGVRIVEAVAGRSGPPVSVLLRGDRIAAIGPRLAVPADAVRVDGRGRFLAAGFRDMHVHSFQLSPQLHLPLFVANGVTSVRDMMDCPQATDSLIACAGDKRRWNAASAAGRMAAPRIVEVASYYLEGPALGPATVSARAAAAQARGIDALKVYNRLSRPAYARAATEARARGLRLVGHLPKAIALDEALAAGQASFEHAHLLPRHCFARAADWRRGALDGWTPTRVAEATLAQHDPAACARAVAALRARGAWLVPTHVTREEDARAGDARFTGDARLAYLDPLSRWAWRDDLAGTRDAFPGERGAAALGAYFDHGLRLTGAAHRAGVGVLVGTDTAIGGFRYHDELAHLVRAGLTPAAVMRAATVDAARYAGEGGGGSVAVGQRAELVLLRGDPLADIANSRRIDAVFLGGRHYDRAALDALLVFVRGQARSPAIVAKLLWGVLWSSIAADL